MYPEKLLSHHFWDEQQKIRILVSRANRSKIAFQNLLKENQANGNEELIAILRNMKCLVC